MLIKNKKIPSLALVGATLALPALAYGVFQESCRLTYKFMPPYSLWFLICSFRGLA